GWCIVGDDFNCLRLQRYAYSQSVCGNVATYCDICRICLVSDLSLSLLPATLIGMGALITAGVLMMTIIGRPDETGLTAITIAVIMIVAANNPQEAWLQPLLRLVDTLIGISIGVACKWIASFVIYRTIGEEMR